jgi:hypothetical protein
MAAAQTSNAKKNALPSDTLYPLGKNVFATVRNWRGIVKIHVRNYAYVTRTDVKGGRRGQHVATQKGVAMDLRQFQALLRVKEKLMEDFQQHTGKLNQTGHTQQTQSDTPSMPRQTPPRYKPDGPTWPWSWSSEAVGEKQETPDTPHTSRRKDVSTHNPRMPNHGDDSPRTPQLDEIIDSQITEDHPHLFSVVSEQLQ